MEIKRLALEQGTTFQQIVIEQLVDFIKEHGDTNSNKTLMPYLYDDVIFTPDFFSDDGTWGTHINQLNEEKLKELENQILTIKYLLDNKINHGNAFTQTSSC